MCYNERSLKRHSHLDQECLFSDYSARKMRMHHPPRESASPREEWFLSNILLQTKEYRLYPHVIKYLPQAWCHLLGSCSFVLVRLKFTHGPVSNPIWLPASSCSILWETFPQDGAEHRGFKGPLYRGIKTKAVSRGSRDLGHLASGQQTEGAGR